MSAAVVFPRPWLLQHLLVHYPQVRRKRQVPAEERAAKVGGLACMRWRSVWVGVGVRLRVSTQLACGARRVQY